MINSFTNSLKGYGWRELLAFIAGLALVLALAPASIQAANTDASGTVTVTVLPQPASGATEYFRISYSGTGTLDLTDWDVYDTQASETLRYTFSGTTLTDGQDVMVCGDDSLNANCDFDMSQDVWNNDGDDSLILRDENDDEVVEVLWTDAEEGTEYSNSGAVDYVVMCTDQRDASGTTDIQNTTTNDYFDSIQDAIEDCDTQDGDTITVGAGNYTLPQIIIDKDLSIVGEGKEVVTITPSENTNSASNNDSAAWILVEENVEFNLSGVTLDGDESNYSIARALTTYGTGTIENNTFKNIKSSSYIGFGVTVFGDVSVLNNTFENIQRVGVHVRKAYTGSAIGTATISGNTFTGQGEGDWVEYGVEIGASSYALIENNSFAEYKGVAISDGSESAGILVTDYYGVGTEVDIEENTLENNTYGVVVGYATPDQTIANITQNNISGNTTAGVSATENAVVNATENWWGDKTGPSGEGEGSGDVVSENVTFSPWLCEMAPSTSVSENDECDGVKVEQTLAVSENTSAGYGQTGWLFNRDQGTKTEYEFNTDQSVIGKGSLYVLPIVNDYAGTECTKGVGCDKFIGEYFADLLVEEFDSLSYDFQIAGAGTGSDAGEFYTNVHANFPGNEGGYGDCKFDFVPSSGTAGSFETFSFKATDTPVRVRGNNCPATLAEMPDGSTIFFFAVNLGDTSESDEGLGGYFDNVVLETDTTITTFDFDPETGEVEEEEESSSSSSGGTRTRSGGGGSSNNGAPTPQVLGVSTSAVGQCGMLLTTYMSAGMANNTWEVMKLQAFLVGQGYFSVKMTGVFDAETDAAVKLYQAAHSEEILQPWIDAGLVSELPPNGNVYSFTRWHINNTVCPGGEMRPVLN